MDKWVCQTCGYVYDEEKGDSEHGIAPGTPFGALPPIPSCSLPNADQKPNTAFGTALDWVCPVCGVNKEQFERLEEA